jgi:hypothetical protein
MRVRARHGEAAADAVAVHLEIPRLQRGKARDPQAIAARDPERWARSEGVVHAAQGHQHVRDRGFFRQPHHGHFECARPGLGCRRGLLRKQVREARRVTARGFALSVGVLRNCRHTRRRGRLDPRGLGRSRPRAIARHTPGQERRGDQRRDQRQLLRGHHQNSGTERPHAAPDPYIIGNEACERFSFYGMRNILVPFLMLLACCSNLPEGGAPARPRTCVPHLRDRRVFLPAARRLAGRPRVFGKYRTILWFSADLLRRPRLPGLFESSRAGSTRACS